MKKLALVLAALAALLLASAAYAGPPSTMLATVDLSNSNVTPDTDGTAGGANGSCSSFSDERPGNWGGASGQGAVTAFLGDPDPCGHCIFSGFSGFARHIELRVLDGIADDSFAVYVMNPGGNWVMVYSYTADPSPTEVWNVHHIYSFPTGKGQGPMIQMKIVPTNVGWSGYNTWGQLGVDYIKVYDH